MARERKIGGKALAARESGRAPIVMRAPATARTTRFRDDANDDGRAETLLQLLTRPSLLFCVSLFAFLVVSGIRAWEAGWFDPIIGPRGAGPIEDGPIRFPPHERAPAKPYVWPDTASAQKKAVDSEEPTADER